MADTKISALTELVGADLAATDVLPVVDTSATTTKKVTFSGLQSAVSSFTELIQGLGTSNNVTDPTNDINIATGRARDGGDTDTLILASALTKQIDASWVVGTNQGGMDTGAVANDTWYYVWLIKRADTAVVDVLFSLSSTAPTMPANYGLKRRIGVVRRGTATNLAYYQDKDQFKWQQKIPVLSSGTATSDTAVTITPAVPPIATSFDIAVRVDATVPAVGQVCQNELYVQIAAGVDYDNFGARDIGNSGGEQFDSIGEGSAIPNTGVFNYRNAHSNTSARDSHIAVTGFKLAR